MITIEKEKIAEMMFDILKKSDELTNLSMADKYIANKINEAINDTHCCESDREQLPTGYTKCNCINAKDRLDCGFECYNK